MKKCFTLIFHACAFIFILAASSSGASSPDRGSKAFWLTRHGEIRPEASALSRRAHDVFRRVLKASDRRQGVEPEFLIINYSGKPWAQSLADGTVILTRNAIDFCYKDVDSETGDARIAFVIGHELAHQFNGDFWHYQFFQAAQDGASEKSKAFDEIRTIVKDSENFLVKELQADQYGVIYASIAGYDIDAVVSEDTNLFKEWARATDAPVFTGSASHPSPDQRAAAVTARLRDVIRHLTLFRAGVAAYYAGMNKESIAMMEEFARYYPSKEVYNNIGAAYLSIAYDNYKLWKGNEALPFMLSFGIDASTKAESIEIANQESPKNDIYFARYSSAIDKAEEYLKRASESGYDYTLSRNNLGCAYILAGRFHEAVAILDEALAFKPNDSEILSNRGIAYYYLADRLKTPQLKENAQADFKKALTIRKNFTAASVNLAIAEGAGGDMYSDAGALAFDGDDAELLLPPAPVAVGKPVPASIKNAVRKGYAHTVSIDGKNIINIFDLPDRGLTIVERNGLASLVISRNSAFLKKANVLRKKGLRPERMSDYGDTELWLLPSQGYGIEFRDRGAAIAFYFGLN